MKKWLATTIVVLGLAGGLVHVLSPIGFNLLGFLGSFGVYVQELAGLSIVFLLGKKLFK